MADRAEPQRAPDKLAFLLALVPYLMDHDRVSVEKTAQHFGMAVQQIRDAVSLIGVSGIPGETATYQHGDLFDIDWDAFEERDEIVLTNRVAIDDSPRFSAREAAALIAGLQYLSALPEHADRDAVASLMTKLSRGASSEPSQVAVEARDSDDTLRLARASVQTGRQLEFDYVNGQGRSERRRIDPLRVESVDADWYLRGWCHLRGAVRTFRLDRITAPVLTSAAITHGSADLTLPDALFETSDDDLIVTVDIAPGAFTLIADYLPDGVRMAEHGDVLRTTVRVSHYDGLKRLVAGLPGLATVIGPPEARVAVAQWALAALARYES